MRMFHDSIQETDMPPAPTRRGTAPPRRRWLRNAALALGVLATGSGAAWGASDFPSKPLRLVVPFATGGSDVMARAFAEKLATVLKQPVVVENRPGGAAVIGASHVAGQPADGYTMLWLGGGSLTPVLIKDLKFEILQSLRSVVSVARGGMTLMVPGSLPVNNFADFLAYAKARPGKLNYSHTAGSILLSGEMLKAKAGFEATAIPYKGSSQVLTALLAKEIDMAIDVPFHYMAMIQDGRIKAIAHGGHERSPSLPAVPTLAEVGVRDLVFAFSFGIWVPAGTPDPIVKQLNAAYNEVLKDPSIRERLSQAGVVPVGGGIDAHAEAVKAEQDMWAAAARQIGYVPQ
jgi:tripartite-type tricarboxylate transporter receptor subunit TctC